MSRFALLLGGIVFFVSPVLGQKEQETPESYSAVAIGTGGAVGGRSIQFDFHVDRYTSDEQIQQFAESLKANGCGTNRRSWVRRQPDRRSSQAPDKFGHRDNYRYGAQHAIHRAVPRRPHHRLPIRISASYTQPKKRRDRTNHGGGQDSLRQEEGALRD